MHTSKSLSASAKPWTPGAPFQPTVSPAASVAFSHQAIHSSDLASIAGMSSMMSQGAQQQAATQQPKLSKTSAKLFVGQLPFECNEQRLKELFGAYGHVEQIHILRDSENRSKGAAFITYSNVEEADTAIFTLHNRYRMLTNRAIQVSYAKNSPNISPFGSYNAMEVASLNPSNPLPDVAMASHMPNLAF